MKYYRPVLSVLAIIAFIVMIGSCVYAFGSVSFMYGVKVFSTTFAFFILCLVLIELEDEFRN